MTFRNTATLLLFLSLFSFGLCAQTVVTVTDEDLAEGTYNWSADTTYLLDGLVILEGGSLTIAPGTIIRAKSSSSNGFSGSALVITKNAQIFAEGTAEAPIIFTSEEDDLAIPDEISTEDVGEWAGIVILGSASVSNQNGGTGYYEGIVFDDLRYEYGGSMPDDEHSSGSLKHVSIRHAAAFSASIEEKAGLVLAGVGRGTTVDHVEVIRSQTNSFRIIGGTVNLYHLVSAFSLDDAFQIDAGFSGKGQFWLGVGANERMVNIYGAIPEDLPGASAPDLANLTLIQPPMIVDDLTGLGTIVFRDNASGSIRNSLAVNVPYGVSVQDKQGEDTFDSWARFQAGDLLLENNLWNEENEGSISWEAYATVINQNSVARNEPILATYMASNNQTSTDQVLNNSNYLSPGSLDPFPQPGSAALTNGQPIDENGFSAVSYQGAFGANDNWYGWTYLGSASGIFQQISGQVIQAESDCTPGIAPLPAAGVIISLESGNTTRYTTTNAEGSYRAFVPAGTTLVNVIPPSAAWAACPAPEPVTLNDGEEATVNLSLSRQNNCPNLQVNIGAAFLRRGFQSTYHITYANTGGITALLPEVMVILDPFLTYQAATVPLADQRGDTLFFFVDDLPPLSSPQQFSLFVEVSLNAALGQEHCTTAGITAENDCIPGTGAELRVTGSCVGDSVRFEVENIGPLDPLEPVPFVVIEDEVMLLEGTLTTPAGSTDVFTFPAEDQTFYFSTLANPDSPSPGKANATISCSDDPVVPFASFASEGPLPNFGIDCQANIGAYDPNDKSAVPLGLTNGSIVPEEVRLDYRIRFQNTGTDTAFTVVVVDTLPESLDLATFVMGTYSHPCSWTLEGERTLKVTFDNIMLPDSNINEPASNGFFKFNIQARPELSLGTEIMNEADIYFDFNEPVRTNQTFHVIGLLKTKPTTGVLEPVLGRDALLLYPQPAGEQLNVSLKNGDFLDGSWVVYGADGRLVGGGTTNGGTQEINLEGWSPGLYVLVLRDRKQRVLGRKRFVVR